MGLPRPSLVAKRYFYIITFARFVFRLVFSGYPAFTAEEGNKFISLLEFAFGGAAFIFSDSHL